MTENDDGSYSMRDRFANPVSVDGGGRLRAGKGMPEYRISKEKVSDGTEEALKAAGDRSTVILALGCNPMISAREDIDRKSMSLPSDQQKLLDIKEWDLMTPLSVLEEDYSVEPESLERLLREIRQHPPEPRQRAYTVGDAIIEEEAEQDE